MPTTVPNTARIAWLLFLAMISVGCQSVPRAPEHAASPALHDGPMPRELSKVVMPEYVIEIPDILLIDAINVIPKAPYVLRTSDVLSIQVDGALPDSPVAGAYAIEAGGVVNLGQPYGTVEVSGKTVDEVKEVVDQHLRQFLRDPLVVVSLLQMSGMQQIAGPHLVNPDGAVHLGTYGHVPVIGMTLGQAKAAIEEHLSAFLDEPEVSVDVSAYNSKIYYIINEGGGTGDQVTRLPVTGNETVLDAISQVGGLSGLASKRIWIARPTPYIDQVQVLPVDWKAITAQASTITNYQIMPGDRVFIAENEWVAFDTRLAKFTAPIQRISGFALLATGTVTRFTGNVLGGGGAQGITTGF